MKSISKYLAKIGAKGGQVNSEAKKAAARQNGKRGGRPRRASNLQNSSAGGGLHGANAK